MKREHLKLFDILASKEPRPLESIAHVLTLISTPRCGSTLFSEALNSSGKVGMCEEWFNDPYFGAYEVVTGKKFDFLEYLKYVIQRSSGDVFSIKAHVSQINEVSSRFGFRFSSSYPLKMYYLYRKDLIAQAVSWAVAVKTNQFRSYEESNGSEASVEDVEKAVVNLKYQIDCYKSMELRIPSFAYEDFQDLSHPCYAQVLASVGKKAANLSVEVRKQRDGYSKELTRRYIEAQAN